MRAGTNPSFMVTMETAGQLSSPTQPVASNRRIARAASTIAAGS